MPTASGKAAIVLRHVGAAVAACWPLLLVLGGTVIFIHTSAGESYKAPFGVYVVIPLFILGLPWSGALASAQAAAYLNYWGMAAVLSCSLLLNVALVLLLMQGRKLVVISSIGAGLILYGFFVLR